MKPGRSPFPGMDPRLEHPAVWPGVHNALIAHLQASLGPALRPEYVVRIEERTYLAVEVPVPERFRETWLEIREPRGGRVVTVLEILSPSNKVPGEGRRVYEEKRLLVLGSRTNLVEIDLLRGGVPREVRSRSSRLDYSILVSRADQRPRARLVTWSIREEIPRFGLPLGAGASEPEVDLGASLAAVYETGSHDLTIDYRTDPVPPLASGDARWAHRLLAKAGRR